MLTCIEVRGIILTWIRRDMLGMDLESACRTSHQQDPLQSILLSIIPTNIVNSKLITHNCMISDGQQVCRYISDYICMLSIAASECIISVREWMTLICTTLATTVHPHALFECPHYSTWGHLRSTHHPTIIP